MITEISNLWKIVLAPMQAFGKRRIDVVDCNADCFVCSRLNSVLLPKGENKHSIGEAKQQRSTTKNRLRTIFHTFSMALLRSYSSDSWVLSDHKKSPRPFQVEGFRSEGRVAYLQQRYSWLVSNTRPCAEPTSRRCPCFVKCR